MSWFTSLLGVATKDDVKKMEDKIMEAIQTFGARVKAAFEKQAKAVDGLVADIETLNKKIEELQNSPGGITPEDQTLLNELEAQADSIATKLEALDAATETVPVPQQ